MSKYTKNPKSVYFRGEKWKVDKVIRPTKYDCYLLCSMQSAHEGHEDRTIPVYICVIDVHNDTFVPVNPKTTKLIQELENLEERKKSIENEIDEIWLNQFGDNWS